MRIDYDAGEDILHFTFSNAPIVRDVSQNWNVNFGFSEAGLAEITILDAKANNYWPIEDVERRTVEEGPCSREAAGLAGTLSEKRAAIRRKENAEAIACYNAYVEQNGLPLAQLRTGA